MILKSSVTAGQTNHMAPAPTGRAHGAKRGNAVAFLEASSKAVAADPNSGTGIRLRVFMRRADIVLICMRLYSVSKAGRLGVLGGWGASGAVVCILSYN